MIIQPVCESSVIFGLLSDWYLLLLITRVTHSTSLKEGTAVYFGTKVKTLLLARSVITTMRIHDKTYINWTISTENPKESFSREPVILYNLCEVLEIFAIYKADHLSCSSHRLTARSGLPLPPSSSSCLVVQQQLL